MLCVDFILLCLAVYFSFALRLGEIWPSHGSDFLFYISRSAWIFLVLPIITIPLFIRLGLYKAVLQYMGVKVIFATFWLNNSLLTLLIPKIAAIEKPKLIR